VVFLDFANSDDVTSHAALAFSRRRPYASCDITPGGRFRTACTVRDRVTSLAFFMLKTKNADKINAKNDARE